MYDFNSFPTAAEAREKAAREVELNHEAELEAFCMEAEELIEEAISHGFFYFTIDFLSNNAIDFLSSQGYTVRQADNGTFVVKFI